jgi:5-methylcytosine-specific restriction endonuclease McrA
MARPAYQRKWQLLCAEAWRVYQPVCWICGHRIDRSLPKSHRLSGTIDHLDPIKHNGDHVPHISRVRPAHRSCNTSRSSRQRGRANRTANHYRRTKPKPAKLQDYGPGPGW